MAVEKNDDRVRMGVVFDTRDKDHRLILSDMENGMGTGKKMAVAPYMVNMYKSRQSMISEIELLKEENERLKVIYQKSESEREMLFKQNLRLQAYLLKSLEIRDGYQAGNDYDNSDTVTQSPLSTGQDTETSKGQISRA